MDFVVKMSTLDGVYVEWYKSLAVRMQALDRQDARGYPTQAAAELQAEFCRRQASAFSEIYLPGYGGLVVTVEPR